MNLQPFLQTSNVGMLYMLLRWFLARSPMVRFSWCVVQPMKSRCIHLSQDLASLLPATISASVHLKIVAPSMLSGWFHVFSNSSSSSQPHHVVTCVRLVSNVCCTCPCVNFTHAAPSPESSFTFMSSIFIAMLC